MFNNKNTKNQIQRRTVNISQPANVFSYHAKRSSYDQNVGRHENVLERSKPRITFRWVLLPSWVAFIAIIISVVYCTTLSSSPRVVVTGGQDSLAQSAATYEEYVRVALKSSIFNTSKLTVSTDAVAYKTQQQFPEIDAISITVPVIARRPVVRIEVSRPAFIVASSQSEAYYVRTDGTASVRVSDVKTPPQGVQTIDDQSGLAIEQGKLALPKTTVTFISEIIRQLQGRGMTISQLLLPTSPNELQVRLVGQPYYIRLDTTQDPRIQAGAFWAVKSKLATDKITPKEYIDVRVEGRAYYR